MVDEPTAAELVDGFLAAPKELAGAPTWVEGSRSGEMRSSLPILVNGESTNAEFCTTAYPEESGLRFTIVLQYRNHCIWRLDFEPDYKRHTNPADRVDSLGGEYSIVGPHYHAWNDNRHLSTRSTLPDMPCARSLPNAIRHWENAFRWFCGETMIAFHEPVFELPPRGRLL
ncbi:MAG: hypothetical protein RID42_01720 [Alphaproteobacteria bacterium]